MLQITRGGLYHPLLSVMDFVLALGNGEGPTLSGKHAVPWQVDLGYCRSEWCSAGIIFLEFNSKMCWMCWRADQNWSPKSEEGLRGVDFFGFCWVVLGVGYFLFCLFLGLLFSLFLVQTDLRKISPLLCISSLRSTGWDSISKAEPYSSGNLKGYTWRGKKRERRRY